MDGEWYNAGMIEMNFEPQVVPLTTDESGTIRVGEMRVRLDTVVYAFNQGYTAEQIVDHYPALQLVDVYAVITYYLGHRPAVDDYIQQREREADKIRYEIQSQPEYQAFREKLLARREAYLNSAND
jgi:uncharacterized protein (DUF433 family)